MRAIVEKPLVVTFFERLLIPTGNGCHDAGFAS